jgi:hypothetical protein
MQIDGAVEDKLLHEADLPSMMDFLYELANHPTKSYLATMSLVSQLLHQINNFGDKWENLIATKVKLEAEYKSCQNEQDDMKENLLMFQHQKRKTVI